MCQLNRHKMNDVIFENLVRRMVSNEPRTYKEIISSKPNSINLKSANSNFEK